MAIRSRAPMRIDFGGGWSDVARFCETETGVVVNAAISLYAHGEFLLGGRLIRLHANDLGERLTVSSPRELVYNGRLDLHKAALNMLPVTGGIEIISWCDAPPGSGLGGSGALDVALVAGLARCRQEGYDAMELAELGFMLEAGELGLLGGKQDQYAGAMGGFLRLDFDTTGVRVTRLQVNETAAKDLAQHCVLVYTGQTHFSPQTHARVWDGYESGNQVIRHAIRAIRDVAGELGVVIESGDWRRLAELVDENWHQQQQLDQTMSTPVTEAIERATREAGAWGLKATGAGAGGCLVILCSPDDRERVVSAAQANGGKTLEYSFALDGVAVWEQEIVADEA